MKVLAIFSFMLGVIYMLMPTYNSKTDYQTHAVATNYIIYRSYVFEYVYKVHPADGEISTTLLNLPSQWIPMRSWKSAVYNKYLYIWGSASSEEISMIRQGLQGSLSIGVASKGNLLVDGNVTAQLPASISDGNVVSVTRVL